MKKKTYLINQSVKINLSPKITFLYIVFAVYLYVLYVYCFSRIKKAIEFMGNSYLQTLEILNLNFQAATK